MRDWIRPFVFFFVLSFAGVANKKISQNLQICKHEVFVQQAPYRNHIWVLQTFQILKKHHDDHQNDNCTFQFFSLWSLSRFDESIIGEMDFIKPIFTSLWYLAWIVGVLMSSSREICLKDFLPSSCKDWIIPISTSSNSWGMDYHTILPYLWTKLYNCKITKMLVIG